jgi:hypothetical protein
MSTIIVDNTDIPNSLCLRMNNMWYIIFKNKQTLEITDIVCDFSSFCLAYNFAVEFAGKEEFWEIEKKERLQ